MVDNTNTTFTASSNGTYTFAAAASTTAAGLQKWVFDATTQQWNLAYTLDSPGSTSDCPTPVPLYPVGINNGAGGTGLPWAPATDGLRNLTGHVDRDGTVTIYAETSTVSGSGDQGADPNKVVAITDKIDATTLPSNEQFWTVKSARDGQVLRGVAIVPQDFGNGGGWDQ